MLKKGAHQILKSFPGVSPGAFPLVFYIYSDQILKNKNHQIGCQYISEWSEWSKCSYKCEAPSTQVRTRTKVENGNDCPTSETQPCQYECGKATNLILLV